MKIKNDTFRKSRGGNSRFLELTCRKCSSHITYYQKDGPGHLKRLYIDRMSEPSEAKNLTCKKCAELIGVYSLYKKENRPCYRLFVDALDKKIVSAKDI